MAKATRTALVVFARAPVAGASKTRLIPALGPTHAAALHQAMIEHTLATLATPTGDHALQLWCAPDTSHPLFARLAHQYDLSLHTQYGDDLGARMYHALDTALRDHAHAIIVGTDCPGLAWSDIAAADQALQDGADAVIGPAEDGGYWLLGLRTVAPALFSEIAWGEDTVYVQTCARLETLGWRWHALRQLADVDRPEDLRHVPSELTKNTRENT